MRDVIQIPGIYFRKRCHSPTQNLKCLQGETLLNGKRADDSQMLSCFRRMTIKVGEMNCDVSISIAKSLTKLGKYTVVFVCSFLISFGR